MSTSTKTVVLAAAIGSLSSAVVTYLLLRKNSAKPRSDGRSLSSAADASSSSSSSESKSSSFGEEKPIPAALLSPIARPLSPLTASKSFPAVPALLRSDQKRILVTGGAGFVGSHLVDALMKQGHLVFVLDNLFTGSRRNLATWIGHPHFQLFQHDVVHPFFIEVDEIYNLACPASPPHYQYNEIKTIKCSTLGCMNMLGLAKRCKARLLFTSTSEVYGDPEVHPQVESYWGNVNCIGLRSCYDEGKRVGETMCYSYQKECGVDVRVARIFNTFGPRMHPDDGRVVSNFIKQALLGQDLTVYGDGKQTRSFQFVTDLVAGLIALMASEYSQPVNLGNPEEFTIKEFAEYIISKVNPEGGRVVHKPATSDDPRKRRPDITRAKTELGWSPKVKVTDGLDKTITYFREELGLPPAAGEPANPQIWMPDIADEHLGCMATRRRQPEYK